MEHHFLECGTKKLIEQLGAEKLIQCLSNMLLIRNFEVRAEAAYQHGKIGGFFHSYIGQEAIQIAAIEAFGTNNWYSTSYRCHGLALALGESPQELMAELFGKATGNAKGRGGSMHFFSERLLGGFGIVGGQIPIATGAGFSLKYKEIKDQISICFMGDGAVVQGSFHEALNLASLWNLPCLYIIENNKWGMGTAVERAVCVSKLAEDKASGYNMKGYTLDGKNFFECYSAFKQIQKEILETGRPVLVEVIAQRFKGHSISDPGDYRSKEEMKQLIQLQDPIVLLKTALIENKVISEDTFKEIDKDMKEKVLAAIEYADNSPWPDVETLEEDVFAP